MIKIAFSSLTCPAWDFATIVARAKALGYDGFEIRGLKGELHLPVVPELAADPQQVRKTLEENKLELICLGSSATLDSLNAKDVARQKGEITEFVELASKLGCPAVRMFVGEVQGRRDTSRYALSRIVEAVHTLTPLLARHGVTLLLENGGDFPGSADLWFVLDGIGHPAVRCCWNQCTARAIGERPTTSIPRLGRKIGLVHICDAEFDAQNVLARYRPPGQGGVEVAREIELLRGIAYDGYLSFEWPKLWVDSLPDPDAVLPEAAKFMRGKIQEQQPVLTAYKGDKNAPRFPGMGPKPPAAAKAH